MNQNLLFFRHVKGLSKPVSSDALTGWDPTIENRNEALAATSQLAKKIGEFSKFVLQASHSLFSQKYVNVKLFSKFVRKFLGKKIC